jgi:hypothetical protein
MSLIRIFISGTIGMGATLMIGILVFELLAPAEVTQYYIPNLIPCFAIFGFPIGIILGLRQQSVRN